MMKKHQQVFSECGIFAPLPMKQYCDHIAVVETNNQEHLLKGGNTKFMNQNLFALFEK